MQLDRHWRRPSASRTENRSRLWSGPDPRRTLMTFRTTGKRFHVCHTGSEAGHVQPTCGFTFAEGRRLLCQPKFEQCGSGWLQLVIVLGPVRQSPPQQWPTHELPRNPAAKEAEFEGYAVGEPGSWPCCRGADAPAQLSRQAPVPATLKVHDYLQLAADRQSPPQL